MTPRLVARADAVAAALGVVDPSRTTWIGVDGRGGAGKSTLAVALGAALPRAVVVHVDDFAAPRIAEWDWERFRTQVVLPLEGGRPARYQRWDWDLDAGAEWHDVPAGVPIVVEGVSSTRDEVGVPWDLTIWVDTPREVRLQRALLRDGAAMLATWVEDWMPSEERYVRRQSPDRRADLIVSGTE